MSKLRIRLQQNDKKFITFVHHQTHNHYIYRTKLLTPIKTQPPHLPNTTTHNNKHTITLPQTKIQQCPYPYRYQIKNRDTTHIFQILFSLLTEANFTYTSSILYTTESFSSSFSSSFQHLCQLPLQLHFSSLLKPPTSLTAYRSQLLTAQLFVDHTQTDIYNTQCSVHKFEVKSSNFK